ncbi:hypothetical protein CFAM422_010619 [Trichoderma lentiforme]|uniref:Uncharacterized protein n=1 Tax=Trichoderma lentiforme TaxID=1567552 RepID=A0A9P4X883_9HYPO|nr:hypothetical protein CFAM422_010619 [Trichoderma lentiforme]
MADSWYWPVTANPATDETMLLSFRMSWELTVWHSGVYLDFMFQIVLRHDLFSHFSHLIREQGIVLNAHQTQRRLEILEIVWRH